MDASRDAPRLLVVTQHFPPSPEVGGTRWQHFANFAVERGWGVDVVCLDPASLERTDSARLARVDRRVAVFGVPMVTPWEQRATSAVLAARARLKGGRGSPSAAASAPAPRAATAGPAVLPNGGRESRIRALAGRLWREWQVLLLDANHMAWVNDALVVARDVVGPRTRAVITSGPPHLVHEVGRHLAAERGLPHVVDMRDPWSLQTPQAHVRTASLLRRARRAEARVFRTASLVTPNTEAAAAALRRRYPEMADRIVPVMNGADAIPIPPRRSEVATLVIAYAGQVYIGRDPGPLFAGAARIVRELGLTPADLRIRFMGKMFAPPGRGIMDLAQAEGIAAYVEHLPPGSHADAMQLLADADILVSLPQDCKLSIPSKIFEYSQFPAWILAFAEPDTPPAQVLAGTDADTIAPHDVDAIAAAIRRRYEARRAGVRPLPANADGRFDRSRQAAILFDAIERLAGAPHS